MALAPGQGLAATVPPKQLPFLPLDVLRVESALDGLQDAYGSQAVILAVCPKGLLTEVKRPTFTWGISWRLTDLQAFSVSTPTPGFRAAPAARHQPKRPVM